MNALVIGVRRTGKSTLAYWLAQESGARLIVIWDPNNNFRAFHGVHDVEELGDYLDEIMQQDQEILVAPVPLYVVKRPEVKKQRYTVRFIPHPNHLADEFEAFSAVLRDKLHGHWALLIDESDEDIQSRQQMTDALAWWVRRAPTDADWPETVEIIQMTHSPQDVYTRARNLLTDVYVFKTQGEPELEWLVKFSQDSRVATMARNLSTPTRAHPNAPRHVLHIFDGPGGEKEFEVLTNPNEWYIQIGSNRSLPQGKEPSWYDERQRQEGQKRERGEEEGR